MAGPAARKAAYEQSIEPEWKLVRHLAAGQILAIIISALIGIIAGILSGIPARRREDWPARPGNRQARP
jgi:hypothetical protein